MEQEANLSRAVGMTVKRAQCQTRPDEMTGQESDKVNMLVLISVLNQCICLYCIYLTQVSQRGPDDARQKWQICTPLPGDDDRFFTKFHACFFSHNVHPLRAKAES
jgi:hypothetical protein